jgi:hypothetical protein
LVAASHLEEAQLVVKWEKLQAEKEQYEVDLWFKQAEII